MAAMSAPIIGKPPEQKRGAVFGDLGLGCLFAWRGETYMKETASTARMVCPGGRDIILGPDRPVIPLTVTPAEPEPDPAVATYGELGTGEWFRFEGAPPYGRGLCRKNGCGGYTSELRAWDYELRFDALPVRRVSRAESAAHVLGKDAGASVVVHEEPGTLVRWLAGYGVYEVRVGGEKLAATRAELQRIVQQGATLLSTPEPTPGDQEPACTYRGALAECHDYGCPVHSPLGHRPESAEDRSKPAPGWEVVLAENASLTLWWRAIRPPVRRACASEADAVEYTWQQRDAEQAREANKS